MGGHGQPAVTGRPRQAIDARIEGPEADALPPVTQCFAFGPAARGTAERLGRVHRGLCVPKFPRGQVRDSATDGRTDGFRVDTSRRPVLRFFWGGVSMAIRWPADERSRQWRADAAPVPTDSASPNVFIPPFRRRASLVNVAAVTGVRDRASHCRYRSLYFRYSSDRSHIPRAMHAVRATRAPGSSRKEPLWKTGRAFSRS